MPRIGLLIVAAGEGTRAGGSIPKQYQSIAGATVLEHSLNAFSRRPDIEAVQIVIGETHKDLLPPALRGRPLLSPVVGGATRKASVRAGLEALSSGKLDLVLIHDAARPLVSRALIDRVIAALEIADAAIPLLSVFDTLKRIAPSSSAWTTVPREGLHRAQTPQGFRYDAILNAHRQFAAHDVTDDMGMAELAGMRIQAVAGEEANLKITTADDLALAERLLLAGAEFRAGSGFDAHCFVPGDHLWLCGVKIAHDKALEGHSDADAGLHALTDAILGAAGLGDIGQHFPPTDPKSRGASSDQFLSHAAQLLRRSGGTITHCDVTLICERPKIAPHRDAMRARIAEILGIDVSRISVKATTTDGMGFTGRGEGLAAQAVATIRLINR